MRLFVPIILLLLTGCIGYQNVTKYERIEGKMEPTYQIKGWIVGTSGQEVNAKDLAIKKSDTSDQVVGLIKEGTAMAVTAVEGGVVK